MFKLIFQNRWLWKKSLKGNYYYPIVPYRYGIRADKNLNIYGGDPISLIIAGTAVAAGSIGAAAISSSAQRKAAKNAEELAREQQQTAINEQRRLEEKYGLTPGELAREQRLLGIYSGQEKLTPTEQGFEERQQKEIERRGGLEGEELLREAGPQTRALLDRISSRFGMTGEQLFRQEGGKPAEQYFEEVTKEGPSAMFAPELELTRQMVNQEANRRGVFGGLPEGGIRFEQLGRAGVDLAIKSASERLTRRSDLANTLINLVSGARGETGTVGERALSEKERARDEIFRFMQELESQSAGAKGRAAQVGIGAAGILQPTVGRSYDNLMNIEGYKGGITGPAEAGLRSLADIGSMYLSDSLIRQKTTPKTSDLSSLRGTSTEYDPEDYLRKYTGSPDPYLNYRF